MVQRTPSAIDIRANQPTNVVKLVTDSSERAVRNEAAAKAEDVAAATNLIDH
ncbi:hypothetical protein ACTXG6_16160 [Pseudonocardia sp. Cha107L01]|uniref:hypothetical protein n=1 Tax=Pseudonocardia sp. Cha107L01 TaxID=3457576 RepID=UPI00403EE1D0